MDELIKRIDIIISICRTKTPDSYLEVKDEIEALIIDTLGKQSEVYKNFVNINKSSLIFYDDVCLRAIGILNAVKTHIYLFMRNKKYNVFISSTFLDLKDYRKALADEIIFRGHFASGMEDFSACCENLETYIKHIIDESDYYVLLLGQRFGSIVPKSQNISYTMMEYEYAKGKGMRIIPFIYNGEKVLDGNDLDVNEKKFNSFVDTIKTTTPQYFKDQNELVRKFSKALDLEIKTHPQKGWIRL